MHFEWILQAVEPESNPVLNWDSSFVNDLSIKVEKAEYFELSSVCCSHLSKTNLMNNILLLHSLKGRAIEAIASACLYIACRQEGVPRTFKEIVAVSTVSKKEIGRCFKLILKAHDTNVDIIQTGDFMNRFCGSLGLPREVQKAATHIAKRSVDLDIVPG